MPYLIFELACVSAAKLGLLRTMAPDGDDAGLLLGPVLPSPPWFRARSAVFDRCRKDSSQCLPAPLCWVGGGFERPGDVRFSGLDVSEARLFGCFSSAHGKRSSPCITIRIPGPGPRPGSANPTCAARSLLPLSGVVQLLCWGNMQGGGTSFWPTLSGLESGLVEGSELVLNPGLTKR